MSRFQFQLATVLRLRQSIRTQRLRALADVQLALDQLTNRKNELERELAELKQADRQSTEFGQIDVQQLANAKRYEHQLLAKLAQLAHDEAGLTVQLENHRQALVEADREVQTLEKLRERRLAEHRQANATAEAKQMDEVAARQFSSIHRG